jgi:Sfi1 spindle body protein
MSLISRDVTLDAQHLAEWTLLKLSFKAWRDDVVGGRYEALIDHRHLQRTFSLWIIRQRGQLLARVRDRRCVHEAFQRWADRFHAIRDTLHSTLQFSQYCRTSYALRSSFMKWREAMMSRRNHLNFAIVSPYILESS